MRQASPRTRSITWPALAPLVLSLAAPTIAGRTPAIAAPPHVPAQSSAAHRKPGPVRETRLVREIIKLQYIDCHQAIPLLEAAFQPDRSLTPFNDQVRDQSPPTGPSASASPGTGTRTKNAMPVPLPPTLAHVFPPGTQLIPYAPQNALIAISTPDGIALLKGMLKPVDVKPRFILFQIVGIEATAKALETVGLSPELATPLTSHGVSRLSYLGNKVGAALQKLVEENGVQIVSKPRLIVPSNVDGGIGSVTVIGRLNSDGTITVFARIEQGSSITGSRHFEPSNLRQPLAPGVRAKNGDTIGLLMHLNAPGRSSGKAPARTASPPRSSAGRSPDSQSENSAEDKSDEPRCLVYFITPNLVDDHGQIVPGGADAVRRAWKEDHPE